MNLLLFAAVAAPTIQAAYQPIWTLKAGGSSFDFLTGMATDFEGGVYASGQTFNPLYSSLAGPSDAVILRLDSEGQVLWGRQHGSGMSDHFIDVASDELGHVFTGGFANAAFVPGGSLGLHDGIVARYDSSGFEDWRAQIGTENQDSVSQVVADGAGGCFAVGSTWGDLGGPNAGGQDVFVATFDQAGAMVNAIQFGTPTDDAAIVAISDGARGFFLSFATRGDYAAPNAGDFDTVLARFDAAGQETWAIQLGSSERELEFELASDGAGGVLVAGTTLGDLAAPNGGAKELVLGHFDGAGQQLSLVQFGVPDLVDIGGIQRDASSERIFVTGWTDSALSLDDAFLYVYDRSWTLLQQRTFGGTAYDRPSAMLATGSGGMYLSCNSAGDFGGVSAGLSDVVMLRFEDTVGTQVCSPAVPNSTLIPSKLSVLGSPAVGNNNLRLRVQNLPLNAAGYFLASTTSIITPMAGGSVGTLCLGGAIGRFVGPGQVQNSSASGQFNLVLSLSELPTPAGLTQAMSGQSWYFQAWHRDADPGPVTNFSDAVEVTFE